MEQHNSNRIIAIDVFRGLTIAAMILVNFPGSRGFNYLPLTHARWSGVTPTDFIFPFFIFIVGISVVLAYSRQVESGKPRKIMIRKIMIRSFNIYMIGLFLHYLPEFNFYMIDLFGVLQRIALVFLACALLYLYTDWKTQTYLFVTILLLSWIALCFVPTSEAMAGVLEPGNNFAAWFDRQLFSPEMLGKRGWNSEGPFSTFTAIATGISGMLAGHLIVRKRITEQTVIWLFSAGIVSILAGSVWDWQFPIIKKIWTSSYVLYTSGWAAVILALSLWVIDLRHHQTNWIARLGVIFGSNAIAAYLSGDLFETFYHLTGIKTAVYQGLINGGVAPSNASLTWALISVCSSFLVVYFLYRRKIFLKL